MPFVVCEECGGYYELQKGESPEDFESCLCGGKLEYIKQNPEKGNKPNHNISREVDEVKESEVTDENTKVQIKSVCPNCLKEDEDGIFCSSCGGKLLIMRNGEVINREKADYPQSHNSIPKKNRKIQKDTSPTNKSEPIKGIESLFSRIKWLGITAGVALLLFGVLIVFYSLASLLSFNYYYSNVGHDDFQFSFNIFILSLLILGIFSGILASYINKGKDYIQGLLNGFMVGAITSVLLGAYATLTYIGMVGIVIIIIGIPILGALSAAGGLVGIFLQDKLRDLQNET